MIERVDVNQEGGKILTASSIEVGIEGRLVFNGEVAFDERNYAFALAKPNIRKRTDLKNPANT